MPGGGPANIAVGLARLGTPTAFAGRFSQTGFGPWLRENLAANGVDLRVAVQARQPATLAVVTLDNQGKAAYAFYGPDTADWHWHESELPPPTLVASEDHGFAAVHTGSLATAFEPGASVIAAWLEQLGATSRVVISFDPNVRAGLVSDLDHYRSAIELFVGRSHLVKASDDDLDALYPGVPLDEAATRWLDAGALVVVVTEGSRGATAYLPGGTRTSASPPPVKVVDTIGAGDSFSSAFLHFLGDRALLSPSELARLELPQVHAALRYAVAASAMTCTRAGADPPTADELAELVRN